MGEKLRASVKSVFKDSFLARGWHIIIEQSDCVTSDDMKSLIDIATEMYGPNPVGGTVVHGLGDQTKFDAVLEAFNTQCGFDSDGNFIPEIYLFPNPIDLDYKFSLSYGTYTGPFIEDIEKTESITVELDSQVSLNYLVSSVVSMEWEGEVFNENGEVMDLPVLTFQDNSIVISEPVVGSIRIVFTALAHTYTLSIPPRIKEDSDGEIILNSVSGKPEQAENAFSSLVMVFYKDEDNESKVATHNLDQCKADQCKPGDSVFCVVEENERNDDGLEIDKNGYIIPPGTKQKLCEDIPEIDDEYTVKFVAFDYCTGEQITDFDVYVEGKLVADNDAHLLESGTYSIKATAANYKDTDEDDLDHNDTMYLGTGQ